MSIWQALLLGTLQGVTEFLPVSSSGHLILAERFFGFSPTPDQLFFRVVLHLGTLVAVVVGLWPEIRQLIAKRDRRIWQIILATLPLFPLVFLLKPLKTLAMSGAALSLAEVRSGTGWLAPISRSRS